MNPKTYVPLACIFFCTACGNKYHKAQAADVQTGADTISTFVLPAIPDILTEPEARAAYLVEHYWDHTNFADTNYIHHPDIVEQAWVNYIDLMKLVPYPAAASSLKNTFNDKGKHKKTPSMTKANIRSATCTSWNSPRNTCMTPTRPCEMKSYTSPY